MITGTIWIMVQQIDHSLEVSPRAVNTSLIESIKGDEKGGVLVMASGEKISVTNDVPALLKKMQSTDYDDERFFVGSFIVS